MNPQPVTAIAVVVIGRNEGERLQRCLHSLEPHTRNIVYVDSGSSDESVAFAIGRGFDVVELDMSVPFSAARARNAGFERARSRFGEARFVQFVDGDCELDPGWLPAALAALGQDPGVAIVCGRRRERFPAASPWNRLCDIEWDTPLGEAEACGGDFLVRAEAFAQLGGFDPTVIAGEEPELCFRLRRAGWRILRIGSEMTLHDAAMTRFSQWWVRSKRAGYAYALLAALHGRGAARLRLRNVVSILAWGGMLPVGAVTAAFFIGPAGLALFLLYLRPLLGIYRNPRRGGSLSPGDALLYAASCVGAKIPQCFGVLRCATDLLLGRQRRIIEYKGAA